MTAITVPAKHNSGYNWEAASRETLCSHLNLVRADLDEARRDVDRALHACILSEEPKDFELLKYRIRQHNNQQRWLAEIEAETVAILLATKLVSSAAGCQAAQKARAA